MPNKFEVYDQFSNPKETLVGDFISVCIDDAGVELFVRYDQLLGKLHLTLHTNGEVLKEETVNISKIYE